MKTFTREESFRIERKMRERLTYSWVDDAFFVRLGAYPSSMYIITAIDVDGLNKKWYLKDLDIGEEVIPLD